MKKYIVDNLANQTITGGLEIDGNLGIIGNIGLTVSGNMTLTGNLRVDGGLTVTDGTYSVATYKALLTQTQAITGTNLTQFDDAFIIGETYTILSYQAGDDFSNIASVSSGTINTDGCVFTAIGSYPTNYSNGSTVVSSGTLAVEVIENTLGFDISWSHAPMGGSGYYFGWNSVLGGLYNGFPRNRTIVKTQEKNVFGYTGEEFFQFWTEIDSFIYKDSTVVLKTYDLDSNIQSSNLLYYTPIEITMKRDMDTTPVVLSGIVNGSYPLINTTVKFLRNGLYDIYHAVTVETSNDLNDLLATLNSQVYTNYFGTYADDGAGGLTLTMPAWLKRQFAEDNILTFEVYAD